MSRLCLTAVLVFLAAGWVYAEATGAPPSKPPPLSLPPIVPLTGSAPETQPAKPAQPAKPPGLSLPTGLPAPPPPPKTVSVAMLLARLRDPDAEKRLAAAESLARSNTRDLSVIAPLAAALKDPDPQVRSQVVIALGHTQDKAALDPLMTAAKDEQFSVRADAIRAIQELGGETALTALATVLKAGDENVRAEVVHAIGQLKDPRVFAALVEALRDPQPSVAIEACGALGDIGDPRALRPLVAAIKSTAPEVRRAAVRAVRWLGVAKESEEDVAFRQKVEKRRIKAFKAEGVELCDVLRIVRETGNVNLHVRWKPLAARKIEPSTPITISPGLLEPDGVLAEALLAADPQGEVGWIIHRGVVIVSTLADLEACAAAPALCAEIPCAGAPADLEVRRKLGLRLPKVECADVALPAFFQAMEGALQLTFKVNWEALKEFDVTPESRVAVALADVPAERVLRLALHDLEATGKIGLGIKDGAVLVTSAAELAPLRQPAAAPLVAPPASPAQPPPAPAPVPGAPAPSAPAPALRPAA